MNDSGLANRIAQADPDDLDALREILYERQRLIEVCPGPDKAAELYRLGEALEGKLRIARAKLVAQSAACYQTGFLLRALASDLTPRHEAGASLDLKA